MFRGTRVFARGVALATTPLRRSAAPHEHAHHAKSAAAPQSATPTSATAATASEPKSNAETSLEHTQDTSNASVQPHVEVPPAPPQEGPKFLFKGRRGSAESEYYMTRSSAGHPDAVAELLNSGRADPEWMWLKLLCFLCVSATMGTTLYGYFFPKHVKYFKDEPWSPFTY